MTCCLGDRRRGCCKLLNLGSDQVAGCPLVTVRSPVGAENRVTLCDLGVLVVEVGEPVALQNAPCRAIADTRVHPRYTAGISEAQRPGPFRRFRATGFRAGTGGDYGSCPPAHASPRPDSPLSWKFIKCGW